MKPIYSRALLAVLVVALMAIIGIKVGKSVFRPKPNFLIIISDDQRYDTMEYMPRTRELIFDQGVVFNRAYVTTSRCCPSRASILTGLYAHNHEVYTNDLPLEKTTMVEQLHEAGYYTGIVGKYLNSYPLKMRDPPRSEFDVWNVFPTGAGYMNPKLNINGTVQEFKGYQAFVLRDLAISFIQEASQKNAPFLLLFTPYTPHIPSDPAPGDENLYLDIPPYRPPNFNEEDISDKPEWLAGLPPLDNDQMETVEEVRLKQIQSLNALDRAIKGVIQELERQGELENTVIIYTSDNGIFWGEHRMRFGKIFVYESATHVPFAIRYPRLTLWPYQSNRLVANIDIAPTIYELAELPAPEPLDGLSLVPLLRSNLVSTWRDYLLLEGWPIKAALVNKLDIEVPFYQAIHTGHYVYVETEGDKSELYDLETDPYQLNNQINNPEYAEIIAHLKANLDTERQTIPPLDRDILENSSGD